MTIIRKSIAAWLPVLAASAFIVTAAVGEDLVNFKIENVAVPQPLTGEPGNPARGRQIVRDMNHVTCLICHSMPIPEEPDHGEIGPPLAGVGSRFTASELRLRLIDPKAVNPATIMPSYYRVSNFMRVGESFRDRPIYTAQQIEDVVAYLSLLKDN